MNFGLPEKSYQLMLTALRQFPEIERVEIFGSRAMGNYKPGSDVDLVLKGDRVTAHTTMELSRRLNEQLPLPYHFDVVNYHDITESALKKHIDDYGIQVKL